MQAFEQPEDPFGILRFKADAIILNGNDPPFCCRLPQRCESPGGHPACDISGRSKEHSETHGSAGRYRLALDTGSKRLNNRARFAPICDL